MPTYVKNFGELQKRHGAPKMRRRGEKKLTREPFCSFRAVFTKIFPRRRNIIPSRPGLAHGLFNKNTDAGKHRKLENLWREYGRN